MVSLFAKIQRIQSYNYIAAGSPSAVSDVDRQALLQQGGTDDTVAPRGSPVQAGATTGVH